MYYKFIIRNKQILLRILFLIAFSFFLKYATHNGYTPNELLGAYQMYMGGIFLEESKSILQIMLLLINAVLFIYYVPYEIIKEIKENEIYIKYRYGKNSKILMLIAIKNLFYSLFYQLVYVFIIMLMTFQFNPVFVIGSQFIKLLLTSTIQLLIISFMSEFFLYCFKFEIGIVLSLMLYCFKFEIGIVLSLMLVVSPAIISGVILDQFSSSLELCKYIPLNHGNYNYYHASTYMLQSISITYSPLPYYRYLLSIVSQVIELVISAVGLMCAIDRKELIGGHYEN